MRLNHFHCVCQRPRMLLCGPPIQSVAAELPTACYQAVHAIFVSLGEGNAPWTHIRLVYVCGCSAPRYRCGMAVRGYRRTGQLLNDWMGKNSGCFHQRVFSSHPGPMVQVVSTRGYSVRIRDPWYVVCVNIIHMHTSYICVWREIERGRALR